MEEEINKKQIIDRILALCHQQPVVTLDFTRFVKIRTKKASTQKQSHYDSCRNKVFQWYEKSANLGHCDAMQILWFL